MLLQSPLAVSTIDDKLKDKMVTEFKHIRSQAVAPLSTFMDFVTCVALPVRLIRFARDAWPTTETHSCGSFQVWLHD